jgi:hypothetical protein
MTATAPGREVDATALVALQKSYAKLVKAGNDSVIAAWQFGLVLEGLTARGFPGRYTNLQIADAMNLSVSTIARYKRLHAVFQRAELALEAARMLETFNIDVITALAGDLLPVGHGRPLAGRHWRMTCVNCGHHEIAREEVDEYGQLVTALRLARNIRPGGDVSVAKYLLSIMPGYGSIKTHTLELP